MQKEINRNQHPALAFFAVGLVALGVITLIYDDFALVWQPVAGWFPGRAALAYGSGLILLLCGSGLLFGPTASLSTRILLPYLFIWLLLKVPATIAAPNIEANWLGLGEIAVLLAGGWMLWARLADLEPGRILQVTTGDSGVSFGKVLFSLALFPIGISHLVYLKETSAYVPAYLPYPAGWAYLTGLGQIAAGAGVLFGFRPRLAATTEALLVASFTLLVWGPAILANPTARLPWTAFFISWAIASAAWVVANNLPAEREVLV